MQGLDTRVSLQKVGNGDRRLRHHVSVAYLRRQLLLDSLRSHHDVVQDRKDMCWQRHPSACCRSSDGAIRA